MIHSRPPVLLYISPSVSSLNTALSTSAIRVCTVIGSLSELIIRYVVKDSEAFFHIIVVSSGVEAVKVLNLVIDCTKLKDKIVRKLF